MPCEQLHRIGTVEVLSAVQARLPRLTSVEDVGCAKKNPRIENSESRGVEVWYLSSGKAMLFVKDRSLGKDIIRRVTTTALRDYPGVAVRGAMVKFRSFEVEGIANAVRDVHQAIEQKRSQLPPVDCRFQRIPFVAECKSSGLPAAGFVFEGRNRSQPRRLQRPNVVASIRRRERTGRSRSLIGLVKSPAKASFPPRHWIIWNGGLVSRVISP